MRIIKPRKVQIWRQNNQNWSEQAEPHQLSNMLTKLDVDALISKTQALKAVCTPGVALPLCFLILLPTQITEAPFVVCSISWHFHTAEILYGLSLSPVTACCGTLQHRHGAFAFASSYCFLLKHSKLHLQSAHHGILSSMCLILKSRCPGWQSRAACVAGMSFPLCFLILLPQVYMPCLAKQSCSMHPWHNRSFFRLLITLMLDSQSAAHARHGALTLLNILRSLPLS